MNYTLQSISPKNIEGEVLAIKPDGSMHVVKSRLKIFGVRYYKLNELPAIYTILRQGPQIGNDTKSNPWYDLEYELGNRAAHKELIQLREQDEAANYPYLSTFKKSRLLNKCVKEDKEKNQQTK